MPDPLLFGCSIYVPFLPTEMLTDMECAFIVEKTTVLAHSAAKAREEMP